MTVAKGWLGLALFLFGLYLIFLGVTGKTAKFAEGWKG